jgi:hypothetical protein
MARSPKKKMPAVILEKEKVEAAKFNAVLFWKIVDWPASSTYSELVSRRRSASCCMLQLAGVQ